MVIFIAALLVLQQSAAADIYLIPPTPVPVVLRSGERAVSAGVDLTSTSAPQRAYLQLAVLGPPVAATPAPSNNLLVKPGMEDAPVPQLKPLTRVNEADLAAFTAALKAQGIAGADITSGLSQTPSGVGVIRVAVDPPNSSQFDRVASRVDAALAAYHNIVGSGVIVQAQTCAFEVKNRKTALRKATALASLLAGAARLKLTAVLAKHLRSAASTSGYQTICGPERAALPMYYLGPPAPGSFHGYPVDIEGGVAFRAEPNSAQPASNVHFLESATASEYFSTLVEHQFVIPDNEPFVSAQGRFSAVVKPDVWVDSVGVSAASSAPAAPHVLDDLARAVTDAGIASDSITRVGSRILVRLTSARQFAAVQTRLSAVASINSEYHVSSSTVPFIAHCAPVRDAVVAHAYREALVRARIMTAAAHLKIGGVIAVNDAGTHDGALCGYGTSTPLKTLLAAIQASSENMWQLGSGSTFSSNMVVAWRLEGIRAVPRPSITPQPAPPYAYSTLNQAFTTHGIGALGEAKRTLRPTQALVSFPFAQQLAPQARKQLEALRWEQTSAGSDLAGVVAASNPWQVQAAVAQLRNAGATPDHLQLRSTACDRVAAAALREATVRAIARAGAQPLQALVDQGSVYRPDASVCGLSNSVGTSGAYIGGSYAGYTTADYSIDERVLAVTSAPSHRRSSGRALIRFDGDRR